MSSFAYDNITSKRVHIFTKSFTIIIMSYVRIMYYEIALLSKYEKFNFLKTLIYYDYLIHYNLN